MSSVLHPVLMKLPLDWLSKHAPGRIPPELTLESLAAQSRSVHIDTQRALLSAVASEGGAQQVVRLGKQQLGDVNDEPLLFVLLNSSSIDEFLEKEQRLNQYFHSGHRIRIHKTTTGSVDLEHYDKSRDGLIPEESLFVFGLHLYLFERLGAEGLRASFPLSDEPTRVYYDKGQHYLPLPTGDKRRWYFSWQRFTPRHGDLSGLDDLLLKDIQPLSFDTPPKLSERLRDIFRSDLTKRWSLKQVSKMMARSQRSLQRALAEEQTSYRQLLEQVRVNEADRMLLDSQLSAAEIGFMCGFSDAAHFSRRFKQLKGTSPTDWRRRSNL